MKSLSINEEIKSLIYAPQFKKRNEIKFKELFDFLDQLKFRRKKTLISIILPLYNEEKTIKTLLEDLPHHKLIEIIVVDDSSDDNSLNEIKKAKLAKKVKIIKHRKNRGYGGSVLTGIKHSSGEIIITMDTDGQHSPDDIYNLIKPIIKGESDYTIGSRYLGSYNYKLPITTRLGETIVEKLIQILFGTKIMNNQNGFRAFNRKLLPIFNNVKYCGYAFCTELILRTRLNGYKIKECPTKVYDREHGNSKVVLKELAIHIFYCIFQYFMKKIFSRKKNKFEKFLEKILSYIGKRL